jgi:hypothetical protein
VGWEQDHYDVYEAARLLNISRSRKPTPRGALGVPRPSVISHIHTSDKLLSRPLPLGEADLGELGPFGPGLCGIPDASFGESPFHALR